MSSLVTSSSAAFPFLLFFLLFLFRFGIPCSGSVSSPGRFLERKMSKVNQIFFLASKPQFRAAEEIFPSMVLVVSSSEKISRLSSCAWSSQLSGNRLSRKCSTRKECCGQWNTGHEDRPVMLLLVSLMSTRSNIMTKTDQVIHSDFTIEKSEVLLTDV